MGRRLLRLAVICQIGSGWETIGLGSGSGCDGNAVQRGLTSGPPNIIESRDALFLSRPNLLQSMFRPGHGAAQRMFACKGERPLALTGSCSPVADSLPIHARRLHLAFSVPPPAGDARASAGLGIAGRVRRSLRGGERREL